MVLISNYTRKFYSKAQKSNEAIRDLYTVGYMYLAARGILWKVYKDSKYAGAIVVGDVLAGETVIGQKAYVVRK